VRIHRSAIEQVYDVEQADMASSVWGDVPTWLSAVATLVALIFAAVAAISARRVYLIESERDKTASDERRNQAEFLRRTQAALVSAWWGKQDDEFGVPRWGAWVRNASETPIYQNRVSLTKLYEPDISDAFSLSVLPPMSEPKFFPTTVWEGDIDGVVDMPDIRVEMTFTDSAGIRWIRDKQGRLSEVLPELTIWTDNQRAATLELFSGDFLSKHHVTVAFRCPPIETMQSDFIAAVVAAETPDVLIGPHDWIGALAEQGLIEPINLPGERRSAFVPRALEAMTYGGRLYGIPYASDSVALLRNTDLAPTPPASIEAMIESGRSMCAAGLADEPVAIQVGSGDGFHIYPLFSSLGGRIFVRDGSGGWNRDAMAGQAARNAFQRIANLGELGDRILRREISRDRALELFTRRRTPYFVSAPWAIGPSRDAGVCVEVSPVPPFVNGEPAQSFVAVHGFFFPAAGKNKVIARDLVLDFLTRIDVAEALYRTQPRSPTLVAAVEKFYADDARTAVYRRLFEVGEMIPSSRDVASIWEAFHQAETGAVAGVSLDVVMRDLSRSIDELNHRT